jgi:hypothetical protein
MRSLRALTRLIERTPFANNIKQLSEATSAWRPITPSMIEWTAVDTLIPTWIAISSEILAQVDAAPTTAGAGNIWRILAMV